MSSRLPRRPRRLVGLKPGDGRIGDLDPRHFNNISTAGQVPMARDSKMAVVKPARINHLTRIGTNGYWATGNS